jgi:hypothetical protein
MSPLMLSTAPLFDHLFRASLGPRLPSAVSLRRCLSASHVWRRYVHDSAGGPTARVVLSRPIGQGREAVMWEETGALMFLGVRYGGLRTRALLRTASRLIGEGRPEQQNFTERELRLNFGDAVAAYLLLRNNASERTSGGTVSDRGLRSGVSCGVGGQEATTETRAWLASTSSQLVSSCRGSELDADGGASHAEPCPWSD